MGGRSLQVQQVIQALRAGGITVVSLHNHAITGGPPPVLHPLLGQRRRRHHPCASAEYSAERHNVKPAR